MKWIFLSPHLDDIAFSCGGLVWDLTSAGHNVEIWTVAAGDPPDDISEYAQALHKRWNLGQDAIRIRRNEDQKACQIIGAAPRYLTYLDCIYRKPPEGDFYYTTDEDIFGGLDPRELELIDQLSGQLRDSLPENARVVAPLGIGNHVDHELTRKAANRLGIPVLFYADYPYAMENDARDTLAFMDGSPEWLYEEYLISEDGLDKWILAIQTYQSQVSTFWADDKEIEEQVREFSRIFGGFKLWKGVDDH